MKTGQEIDHTVLETHTCSRCVGSARVTMTMAIKDAANGKQFQWETSLEGVNATRVVMDMHRAGFPPPPGPLLPFRPDLPPVRIRNFEIFEREQSRAFETIRTALGGIPAQRDHFSD